jgi:DNA-binding MarR family transcriptional regulator
MPEKQNYPIFDRIDAFSQDPSEMLAFSFAYIGSKFLDLAEKNIFRPNDISSVNYNILASLSQRSPRSAKSIAPIMVGSPANFSAILRRMEESGLITRAEGKEDKRVVMVSWTPKGEEIFQKTRVVFQNFFQERFKNVSQKEMKEMIQFLKKFSEL